MLEFGLGKSRKAGRQRECSGDGTLANFNWSALRAIGSYKQARTGSNRGVTDPRSAGHRGVLHGSAKSRVEWFCGLCEFF
jgi:hypothetical protein